MSSFKIHRAILVRESYGFRPGDGNGRAEDLKKKKKKRCSCCARFPIEIKTRYYRCRIQIYAPLKCFSWKERSLQLGKSDLHGDSKAAIRIALDIRFSFNANRLYRNISLLLSQKSRVVGICLWIIFWILEIFKNKLDRNQNF